jgi:4-oxalocrotonate tautomerase
MTGRRQPAPLLFTEPGVQTMPIVTIQITREGNTPGTNAATAEEKARLIQGASELLRDVLNKPLDATFVVIEEVDLDNWGVGGVPVEAFRRQLANKAAEKDAGKGG